MRTKSLLLILLLLIPAFAQTQELMPYAWRSYIELLSEEGEDETAEELLELYELYREKPCNINDTASLLRDFPFINDWQRAGLKAYIILYGPLLSIEELYTIHGFDSMTVELLRPLITTAPIESEERLTLKEILAHGRSNLVMGMGSTVEQARGYRDSIYEGNDMRLMWRYYFKYKERIQLQLSGDKDPGEAFFTKSQPQGFDFYGYSLMINDIGRYRNARKSNYPYIRRLLLGQYHAQFGQGLTLWSGFGPRASWETNLCRSTQGLRPGGAFTEYGYLRGAGATIALTHRWELALVYSYVERDATLPRSAQSDPTVDWVQSLYNSGYHRTATEIGKRNQLGEHLVGGHLEYHTESLKLGLTGTVTLLEKEIVPATYVYNDNVFRGKENINIGFDASYRHRRLLIFSEMALCANHAFDSNTPNISPAAVIGGEFIFNNNHRATLLARYYSPTYHNLHAIAFGQSSSPQNEAGVGCHYQGKLPLGITATGTADLFYFPHMKYLVYGPSHGQEYRVSMSRPIFHIPGMTIHVRYRYKSKGRNITPSTLVDGHYLMEQTYRHQVQGDLELVAGSWRLVTRIGYAQYHGDSTAANHGLLLYQDIQYRPKHFPLTLAARVAWFDVNDYEARLYTVESDFIYQYNTMAYQNEGYRCYLVAKYDINSHWNIGVKYGITAYSDRDTFGSSYEQIDANHRQQWRVQMRLKW